MKILISYTNGNDKGGSECYHHELITGLSKYKNLDITVATLTEPNFDFQLWQDIIKLGIKVEPLGYICQQQKQFDLIIVSQPYPTSLLCHHFPNTPKISIIHSALRSEEPIKHESIKQYISVQVDIKKLLKRSHNIESELIYNPVDPTRFNKNPMKMDGNNIIYYDTTGVFVGEVNDLLRVPMVDHLVQNCIQNNHKLICISRSKRDFNTDLVTFVEPTLNTEHYLKNADFAAGLRGRVAIESYMCGVPFYAYDVDSSGRILKTELVTYMKTRRFEREFVSSQHYNLYKQVLDGRL
jgi:glycosyltransferase involved in cell wall biosynthesis